MIDHRVKIGGIIFSIFTVFLGGKAFCEYCSEKLTDPEMPLFTMFDMRLHCCVWRKSLGNILTFK